MNNEIIKCERRLGWSSRQTPHNLHGTFKQTKKTFSRGSLMSPCAIQGMKSRLLGLGSLMSPSGSSSLDIVHMLWHRKVICLISQASTASFFGPRIFSNCKAGTAKDVPEAGTRSVHETKRGDGPSNSNFVSGNSVFFHLRDMWVQWKMPALLHGNPWVNPLSSGESDRWWGSTGQGFPEFATGPLLMPRRRTVKIGWKTRRHESQPQFHLSLQLQLWGSHQEEQRGSLQRIHFNTTAQV